MQQAMRPTAPLQAMRPIGAMPTGLPPPQRPPAGYRPHAPTENMLGAPVKPVNSSSPNLPSQKMAEMNLNSPYSNQDNGTFNFSHRPNNLSNGVTEKQDNFLMGNQVPVSQSTHEAPSHNADRSSAIESSNIAPSEITGHHNNMSQVPQQMQLENHHQPVSTGSPSPYSSPHYSQGPPQMPNSPSFTGPGMPPFTSMSATTSFETRSNLNSVSPSVSSNSHMKGNIASINQPPYSSVSPSVSSISQLQGNMAPINQTQQPYNSFARSPRPNVPFSRPNLPPGNLRPPNMTPGHVGSPGMPLGHAGSPSMPLGHVGSPSMPLGHVVGQPSFPLPRPGIPPHGLGPPPPMSNVNFTPQNSQIVYSQSGMQSFSSPMVSPHSPSGMATHPTSMTSAHPGMSPFAGIPPPGSQMRPAPSAEIMSGEITSAPSLGSSMLPHASGPGMQGPPMTNMPTAPPVGGMQNRYPGAPPAAGGMGGYSQGQQGRRLNPDDMPSPLQVMEEDRQCKSGEFFTNTKGAVPPLVTTDFFVKDGGNASPHFIRSTMYSVPATPDMMKQSSVPFSLIISPFANLLPNEAPLYMGTSLVNGPVRCNRCKAYMSPHMVFMNGGRRFQCLLCKQVNEVPPEYHCHMDSQGARADKFQRPELCLGSYEFIATPEYCKDKVLPKEPAFIFVLEMSQMMLQRGIINILCQNMKDILQHLPKDNIPGSESAPKSTVKVGFITYDSSVHFYKLTGLAPEMCILCDKEEMFVPVPDGVLCDVEDVSANIDKLMECIPQNFQTTRETSGALYCAIQAGMSALKASGRAGKLFVFHSSLPIYDGPGKLKNREDRKLLGTEKEKVVLNPQNTQYNNLAQDLVSTGCSVDLYVFNESYIDLATIGQVARLTGGQCYKYTYFQPNKDSERLLEDLKINISRDIAFDGVMRVRTSTGVRPVEFYGHFFMSNTQDIELAAIDANKAVAVEIKHDDKITEEDGVYIQVALLYTSVGGQRRLRIINLALNVCTQMADLYKNCELDALMNFFGKQAMFKFLESSAKEIKDALISRTAQMLACYRKNCATPSSAGQLILPELMKLLPLYINCLTKCDALSGGPDMTCDDRSWHIYQLLTLQVAASVAYFYPRLLPLTNIHPEETDIPPALRSSYEKLNPEGVFLLENGLFMFLWVGSSTPASWMNDVFGVAAPHHLDPVLSELPELDNAVSKRIRNIINAVREQRQQHLRLFVVPQQGKHEIVMRNYLVEDKGVYGGPSYVDFLCHVHKEIRALLS